MCKRKTVISDQSVLQSTLEPRHLLSVNRCQVGLKWRVDCVRSTICTNLHILSIVIVATHTRRCLMGNRWRKCRDLCEDVPICFERRLVGSMSARRVFEALYKCSLMASCPSRHGDGLRQYTPSHINGRSYSIFNTAPRLKQPFSSPSWPDCTAL